MTNCIKTIHLIISGYRKRGDVVLLHQVLDVFLKSVQIGFQRECVCVGQFDGAVEI